MISDTIVAPATPYGIGGIAVVRMSGPQSLSICRKIINNNVLSNKVFPRLATLVELQNDHGSAIDEALVTFFSAPSSYTGEDVIELSCHGNPIIVDKIIGVCCNLGARLAEPGEFTKRAFINGKMDLIQAESVAALINSQSEESGHLNLRLLRGELSTELNELLKQLINILSLIEFELDISEDNLQPNLKKKVIKAVDRQLVLINKLLGSFQQARLLNKGALVIISGPPNVGKSTLLNKLSLSDRAIISKTAGTTRDAIDVPLVLGGVPISLVDTAGIRQAKRTIEKEGVRRSIDYLKRADLILSIKDIKTKVKLQEYHPRGTPVIEIINKTDLLSSSSLSSMKIDEPDNIYISAKTGVNVELLVQLIKKQLGIVGAMSDVMTITTNRQQRALVKCQDRLDAARRLLAEQRIAYELVSIEIREALDAVGAILGKTMPDDILNNIFNQFCVGK